MIFDVIRAPNNCSVKCNVSKHIVPTEENPTEETGGVREDASSHSIAQAVRKGCLSAEIQVSRFNVSYRSTSHQPLKTQDDSRGSIRVHIESSPSAYSSLVSSGRLGPVSPVGHAWWTRQVTTLAIRRCHFLFPSPSYYLAMSLPCP